MNMDSEVVDMIAKVAAVNAVAVLLLAVMSYGLSALLLSGLASLDRWLDLSRMPCGGAADPADEPNQPSQPIPLTRDG